MYTHKVLNNLWAVVFQKCKLRCIYTIFISIFLKCSMVVLESSLLFFCYCWERKNHYIPFLIHKHKIPSWLYMFAQKLHLLLVWPLVFFKFCSTTRGMIALRAFFNKSVPQSFPSTLANVLQNTVMNVCKYFLIYLYVITWYI